MKGHNVAHTGQYQCLRGCKLAFKTLSLLDEHIKLQHSEAKAIEYSCDKCDSKFIAQYQLRQHITKKHANSQTRINCEQCGQILTNSNDMKTHIEKEHGSLRKLYHIQMHRDNSLCVDFNDYRSDTVWK